MNNKYTLTGLLLLLTFQYNAIAQMADSVKTHIDSCLLILKHHSLYSKNVNWPLIEESVYEKAYKARSREETFDALKTAFDALGDQHAVYYHYKSEYRVNNEALLGRYSDSIRKAWSRGPAITTKMIGRVAYLSVPYMGATRQDQINWYAKWLTDSLQALQQHHPDGWILDLRLNGGGNIRPMLAGLAMFFEDGIINYYMDKDGQVSDATAFRQGVLYIDDVRQTSVLNTVRNPKAKVAVLIGPGTASSGEILAAVFSRRDNTILIGDSTAGLANATNGFVFNNNNNYFLISTARITDQYRNAFAPTIHPTWFIKSNEAFSDIKNDILVKHAVRWINQ